MYDWINSKSLHDKYVHDMEFDIKGNVCVFGFMLNDLKDKFSDLRNVYTPETIVDITRPDILFISACVTPLEESHLLILESLLTEPDYHPQVVLYGPMHQVINLGKHLPELVSRVHVLLVESAYPTDRGPLAVWLEALKKYIRFSSEQKAMVKDKQFMDVNAVVRKYESTQYDTLKVLTLSKTALYGCGESICNLCAYKLCMEDNDQ